MSAHLEIDHQVLSSGGCVAVTLDKKERWRLEQRWREAFASGVKQKTGKWTHLEFDWHAFSFGFTQCLRSTKALEAYSRMMAQQCVVTPHYPNESAFLCKGGNLPSYLGRGLDRYVFDLECTWTMVFTHEDQSGPFYCERRWLSGGNGVVQSQ
jgi:uncharacterized protein DUF4275